MVFQATIHTRSRSNAQGFTLIEVVVVMLLVALMLTIFVGYNSKQQLSFQLRSATRTLYGFLQAAQGYAVLEAESNTVTYDPATNGVSEELRGKSIPLPERITLSLADERGRPVIAVDQDPDQPREIVHYYPDGGADPGIIRLDLGTRTAFLRIDPILGDVKILATPPGPAQRTTSKTAVKVYQ